LTVLLTLPAAKLFRFAGLRNVAPLLSTVKVQAENDDGDLAEMRDGVIAGLGLSAEEAKAATSGSFPHCFTAR
jgi:hypothetical protein